MNSRHIALRHRRIGRCLRGDWHSRARLTLFLGRDFGWRGWENLGLVGGGAPAPKQGSRCQNHDRKRSVQNFRIIFSLVMGAAAGTTALAASANSEGTGMGNVQNHRMPRPAWAFSQGGRTGLSNSAGRHENDPCAAACGRRSAPRDPSSRMKCTFAVQPFLRRQSR